MGESKDGYLTVWDVVDALDDLENLAETFEANYFSEGMKVRGQARSLAATTTGPHRGPGPRWASPGDQRLGTSQRHRPPGHKGREEPCQRHQRHHNHGGPARPVAVDEPGLSRVTPLAPRILAIRGGLRGLHLVQGVRRTSPTRPAHPD